MGKLFIKNGQITNEKGDIILPEIGNVEHIALLNKYNKAKATGINSLNLEAKVTIEIDFKCLCGKRLYSNSKEKYIDTSEYIECDACDFEYETIVCRNCNHNYQVAIDDDGDIIVKLI
ncbi:hypothetical protein D0T49_04355 [Paludibacter sp. 221]|uniref:hypothetical protein n=1 Tax=Paludibacter sp. 221 TaxID=2302939 RepID=UPI0013D30C41|nr:hypothetical protein [Paludibacter sp. 221]NDV46271.1 hypothetical protein [Paludibacter sp. 221]